MTEAKRPVFNAALLLPPDSRSKLAELLLDSLPGEGSDAEVASEIQSAWVDEAKRRMKEVDEAGIELVQGEEAMERFRHRMKR